MQAFYLIVDNSNDLKELLPLGVKLVQLRIKTTDMSFIKKEILKAKDISFKYNCQLIINDYWQQAVEAGIEYVHLGQEDIAACDIEKLAQTNLKIGVSTHTIEELNIALNLRNILNINYIALGPIYPTKLKKMNFAPQGLENIAKWKWLIGNCNLPLVAIGGLTPERAKLCLEAGADSTAVVTDISMCMNPKKRTIEWIKKIQNS